jgi:hypothetical protein
MDFEYGCITTNKYSFLNENEVEDPSDLLAQVNIATKDIKESSTITKAGLKNTKTSKSAADTKLNTKQASTNKDNKKQPLQQHTENSVKSGKSNYIDEIKKEGKQKQTGQQRQAVSVSNQAPREDKENSTNKQREGGAGSEKKNIGQYQNSRNERRVDRSENNDRPPRRMGPRNDLSDKPERQERPRPQQQIGEGIIDVQVNEEGNIAEGEENSNSGFKRGNNIGNFRGGRNGFGRTSNFRSQYRHRRINDPDHPREFDRHSGSEKTFV